MKQRRLRAATKPRRDGLTRCDNDNTVEEPMKVTLTEPGLAGDYIVAERHADGSVLLAPDTSIEAIRKRTGTQPMTAEQFAGHFGDLPSDGEG